MITIKSQKVLCRCNDFQCFFFLSCCIFTEPRLYIQTNVKSSSFWLFIVNKTINNRFNEFSRTWNFPCIQNSQQPACQMLSIYRRKKKKKKKFAMSFLYSLPLLVPQTEHKHILELIVMMWNGTISIVYLLNTESRTALHSVSHTALHQHFIEIKNSEKIWMWNSHCELLLMHFVICVCVYSEQWTVNKTVMVCARYINW